MIQDGAVTAVPQRRLAPSAEYRLHEVGDYYVQEHIDGTFSVGVVRNISIRGVIYVEWFGKRREDPGKQEFPEFDLMSRAAERPEMTPVDPAVCEAKLNSPPGRGWA